MPVTILATILYFFFLITLSLKTIYTLYIWQRKEYRGDKMLEWLSHPEGRSAVFNRWFQIRSLLVVLLCILLLLNSNPLLAWFTSLLWVGEALLLGKKAVKKTLSVPVFTSKVKIATVLTVLNIFLWLTFWKDLNVYQLQIWLNIVYLALPVITGYCFLLLFPLDWYVKERLFKKAKEHRKQLQKLKVVAISGSYGKTTIKEYVDFLLSDTYKVEKTIKNQNSNVSCARKTLTLGSDTDVFLCELGAYKRGDGAEICKFIDPDIAVVSGMNNQHFGLFGSEQNIILAESEALQFLDENQPGIINYSSPLNRKVSLPDGIKKYRYTVSDKPIDGVELVATDIETNINGSTFTLWFNQKAISTSTNQISVGNVENILAALAVCMELGQSLNSLLPKLQHLPQVENRLHISHKEFGVQLYNAYNNIDGIENILDLASKEPEKQVCVILDDINELGKEARATHERLAEMVVKLNPDKVCFIGKSYSNFMSDICVNQGMQKDQIIIQPTPKEVSQLLKNSNSWLVLNLGLQSKYYLDV